jgi:hypothetical protein
MPGKSDSDAQNQNYFDLISRAVRSSARSFKYFPLKIVNFPRPDIIVSLTRTARGAPGRRSAKKSG